jgi:FkbM family methyltransferase
MLKHAIKSGLRRAGFSLERARPATRAFIPYIERYELSYRGGTEPARFDFWLANRSAELWYKEWFYAAERPTWELDEFGWLVEPGDRILEIGCHHGFLTMMLAHRVGPGGFILGLDANPENALIAQAQTAMNSCADRCRILFAAAAKQPGPLEFSWRTNSHAVVGASTDATYPVIATTGDALDVEFGPFNVLKVDVEGFEVSVLEGCQHLLARRPKLILELHPHFMRDYGYGDTLEDIFRQIGVAEYEGTLTRFKEWGRPQKFSPEAVPNDTVSYLCLQPKFA